MPLAKYGTPSTDELSLNVLKCLGNHKAILLENHGVLTMDSDVFKAYEKLTGLESCAKIILMAKILGKAKALDKEEIKKLLDLKEKLGL